MSVYYGYGLRSCTAMITRTAEESEATGLPRQQFVNGFDIPEIAAFTAAQQALEPVHITNSYVITQVSCFARRFWYDAPETLYINGSIEYMRETARDAKHLEHVHDGKIIFLPYATGHLDWVSVGSHNMESAVFCPDALASQGWYEPTELGLPPIQYLYGSVSYVLAGYEFYQTDSLIPPLDLGSGFQPFPDMFRPEVDTGCVTEAVADANDGFWDLLTEAAELPETLGFLHSAVTSFVGFTEEHIRETDKVLKRWRKPLKQLPKWLSNRWVQYRYAVMPMIYSIQDISKVLENLHRDFVTTRSKRTESFPFLKHLGFAEALTFTDRCCVKRSYEGMSEMGRLFAMVQMNPVKTLFELSAYSFVLEWAINISDFLSATLSPEIFSEQAACYSRRIESSVTMIHASGYKTTVNVDTYARIPIKPSDHIGLDINVSYGWKRQVDSVALSYQALSSRITNRSRPLNRSITRRLQGMGL